MDNLGLNDDVNKMQDFAFIQRDNPVKINYTQVSYNDKNYVVGHFNKTNGKDVYFVIDEDDCDKVKDKCFHAVSNYIGCPVFHENSIKCMYLHSYIMNKFTFNGKGQDETVDHINRIPYDNRKENLRMASQTQQNINQSKKARIVELPEGCGINSNDIPKHIWYIKANGHHGERFAIEFKTENIVWKTSSSKKFSLMDKLEEAKSKLREFYGQFPYLNPDIEMEKRETLTNSFNNIIRIAIGSEPVARAKAPAAPADVPKPVSVKKEKANNLPEDCGIAPEEIPKYVYYSKAHGLHGDCFRIDIRRSPLAQIKWSTTTSKKVSLQDKFAAVKTKLEEIYKENPDLK